jgi:hypothetical protein
LGDFAKSDPEMAGDVLEEAPFRLDFADDARDVRPEVARVFAPELLAGDAERLTRVAARDEIHDATPRLAVKGAKVRPNRCWVQPAVFNARRQDGRDSSFPFQEHDGARAWLSHSECEVEASISGTEGQHVEGR